MAAVAKKDTGKDVKLYNYSWSGKDKTGKTQKGEMRAGGEFAGQLGRTPQHRRGADGAGGDDERRRRH